MHTLYILAVVSMVCNAMENAVVGGSAANPDQRLPGLADPPDTFNLLVTVSKAELIVDLMQGRDAKTTQFVQGVLETGEAAVVKHITTLT